MDSGLTIRPARIDDAEKIFALVHLHRDELIVRPMGDIVKNTDRFLVAECGGRTVACAAFAILPEFGSPVRAAAEIQSVAVLAPMRRRGIGARLVGELLERIRATGVKEALVLTFAPEFFGRLGFREIPKTEVMHKLYTGCINCTKHADPFTCPEKAMVLRLP